MVVVVSEAKVKSVETVLREIQKILSSTWGQGHFALTEHPAPSMPVLPALWTVFILSSGRNGHRPLGWVTEAGRWHVLPEAFPSPPKAVGKLW